MSYKELLELAANAARMFGYLRHENGLVTQQGRLWNPLTDDGDALRLAVKLKIRLDYQAPDYRPHWTTVAEVRGSYAYCSESGEDPYAATRRAIVRAAAEIGKAIEDKADKTDKLICPRCGVDRFKVPCPGPLHLCPIRGEAQ